MADSLQSILDELNALSSDEIALKFEGLGIKGYKYSAVNCPVAVFLSNNIGERVAVSQECTSTIKERVFTPSNVAEFILKFDLGKYPTISKPYKLPRE